jgi:hypothetical protein
LNVIQNRSSVLTIGCRPAGERSMMASLRWPNPVGPSTSVPSPSGPRWAIRSHIRWMTAADTGAPDRKFSRPAIPHIGVSFTRAA